MSISGKSLSESKSSVNENGAREGASQNFTVKQGSFEKSQNIKDFTFLFSSPLFDEMSDNDDNYFEEND